MKQVQIKQDFFKKILVFWLGIFAFLIPLAFCFYTYDSAQIKTTLFYLASCGAFFIWLSALLFRGENIFTKKNFYTFLPILVYAAYILISYILKPYILVRTEPFAREFFCLALFFAIAFELKEEDFKTILKFSFAGAFIVFSYGLLQILNLDFLPWKNFFSTRSFATLANPNLLGSYALFISILVLFSYLIKRQKILIILFVLALLNLIFSQSKGAYLSFALCVLLGSAFFVYLFTDKYKNNRTKIIAVSLVLFIGAGLSILYFGSKRGESFSFRLSTWRASLDMVRPSALTGTGIGSFEVIYPAYKRPEIFYIEKIHNIETQHAENYFLEQLTSLGFIGFGLFLWVLWYISKQVLFKIKTFSRENGQKAFLLAGLSLGSLSIYIHNLVDVSIYFASTTFFLILFNGAIFNLSFGPFEKNNVKLKNGNNLIFKIVFALVILILFGIFF
ncbi:MAG: O-antigen ligase family protein, partial [Elusimicrobiaceae bacterium]|nr:O-antigen ligase family protein [Elusimicrobiaceae bacterium]